MKFPITYLLIALLVGIHTTCCSETLEIGLYKAVHTYEI
jgi:hypothetical protein